MKEGKVTEYDKELQTGFGEKRVGRIVGNDGEEFEIRKLDESLQTGFFEKKVGRIVKTSFSGGGGGGGSGFFENIKSSIFGTLIFLAIGEIILFCVIPDIIKKMGMELLVPTFFWVLTIIFGKKENDQIGAVACLLFLILSLLFTLNCAVKYSGKI